MKDQITKPTGHEPPPDRLARRLRWAIVASLLVNLIGWRAVAAMAKRPLFVPRPVEITRVIIDNKGHKVEKKITKEQIKRHVVQIKHKMDMAPKLKPAVYHQPQKPPEHSKVITAPSKGPGNDEPTVAPGGNAEVGKPIEQPVVDPAPTVKTEPAPVVKAPEPVKVDKKPDPAPAPPPVVAKAPDPPPVVTQPDPPPVIKKGPTREATPTDQVKPEIPDNLKHGSFKSFVRVKVEIDEDGGATTILRTSSGNDEIDRRVLDALKKWKWKPALQNGTPVSSVALFKFEFLVE